MGRLSRETAGATGMTFSYDAMGRVVQNGQCTPRTCFASPYGVPYSYDLMGNPLTASNGLGTTFSYGYNVAGRLTSMTSSWNDANHPGTLLNNVHYGAFGLSSSNLGNGVAEAATYNTLGELASYTAAQGGTTRYNFGLSYAADGNITSDNDSQNGNWSYTYDPFNRLKTASQTGQAFQWDYDRYGNRWHQTVTLGSGGQSSVSFSANNNQVDGETYDAAGNVTHVGARTYTYDAENRLISVAGDVTASYVYDAEGRRIKTQTHEFLYNLAGRPLAVLDASSGANIYDEIYAGGRHLATYSASVTNFNHTDRLGTERVRTGPTGVVSETCTSLPFGDGQTCTGPESSLLHFTGDERDSEVGLDHTLFRQYQSGEARWLSVDPLAGNIRDPQSLNRYAYVGNNPINNLDTLGLFKNDCTTGCRHQGGYRYDSLFLLELAFTPTAYGPYTTVNEAKQIVDAGLRFYYGNYDALLAINMTDDMAGFKLQPIRDCLRTKRAPLGRNIIYQIIDQNGLTKLGDYYIHEVLNFGSTEVDNPLSSEKNGFNDILRFGVGTPPNTLVQMFRIASTDTGSGIPIPIERVINGRSVTLPAQTIVMSGGTIRVAGTTAEVCE